MSGLVPPGHLTVAISMLRAYVQNTAIDKPFVAIGSAGSGRGHWVEAILRENGYRPVWSYDPDLVINGQDMDGNLLFPVYDLYPISPVVETRCVVFAGSAEELPPSMRGEKGDGVIMAAFPSPPEIELAAFLASRGYPAALAAGNPSYSACVAAMRAWDAASVAIRAIPAPTDGWAGFRDGADPPVDGALFGYYAAYHLPPGDWSWNHALWIERRAPAAVSRILWWSIRLGWPPHEPAFPPILRAMKKSERIARREAPDPPVAPPMEKSYSVDW